jgi:trigger factor
MTQVDIEKIDAMKRELTVTVPSEKVQNLFDEQYDYIKKNMMIPGFRKGKAPKSLLKRQFGKRVREVTSQELVQEESKEILSKPEYESLVDPEFIDSNFNDDGTFEFRFYIVQIPDFELKPYEDYSATIEVPTKESLMKESKESYRKQYMEMEPKEDEGAEEGDTIFMNYKLFDEEGELVEEQDDFSFELGNDYVYDEFNEKLEGVTPGDELNFSVVFPKDYMDKRYAGQKMTFDITIQEVKTKVLPEIDEDFAMDLGCDSLEELYEEFEDEAESRREEIIYNKKTNRLIEIMDEDYDFELSEKYFDTYFNYRIKLYGINYESFTEEEKEDLRENLKKRLRLQFVLRKIAQEEEIAVDQEDINNFFTFLLELRGQHFQIFLNQFLTEDENKTFFLGDVLHEKVFDVLVEDYFDVDIVPVGEEENNEDETEE